MRKRFLGLAFALLPSIALAEPKADWIADPRTGCKVWNPKPQPNQMILWSGLCGNGIANGRGFLQWFKDGKLVLLGEGNYRDGRLHGRGVYTWANDDRYEGDYYDGKQQGRGVYTWENGNRYEGDYVDDKPHGQGVYTLTDGNSYSGQWSNGCFKQGDRKAWIATTKEECGFVN